MKEEELIQLFDQFINQYGLYQDFIDFLNQNTQDLPLQNPPYQF